MYKSVFQNSKAALAFAGLTVFSAVSLVGTSDDSGIVTTVADFIGAQRATIASEAQAFAEGQSHGDQAASGSGSKTSVFGEYEADSASGAKSAGTASAGGNPMTAPLSATAIVDQRGPTTVSEPFISDREMTIEPE